MFQHHGKIELPVCRAKTDHHCVFIEPAMFQLPVFLVTEKLREQRFQVFLVLLRNCTAGVMDFLVIIFSYGCGLFHFKTHSLIGKVDNRLFDGFSRCGIQRQYDAGCNGDNMFLFNRECHGTVIFSFCCFSFCRRTSVLFRPRLQTGCLNHQNQNPPPPNPHLCHRPETEAGSSFFS